MKPVPIARAAHLLPYVEHLRQIGTPVERELERFRLSATVREQPDQYVPVLPALSFLSQMAQREGHEELGLFSISNMDMTQLSTPFLRQAQHAPTLYAVLDVLFKLAYLEDPLVRFWLDGDAEVARICSSIDLPPVTEGLEFSEWLQNMGVVAIVRRVAGPQWCPPEMAFRSRIKPGRFSQKTFPNTRFLIGQPCAWISLPRKLLSLSPRKNGHSPVHDYPSRLDQTDLMEDITSLPGSLKLLLKPYLPEGCPDIRLAAEMAGMNVRTLQRRLSDEGLNYSILTHQVRLESAIHLLKDRHRKVIDVAYEVGYEDPSNFARAFRAFTGLSPLEFRHHAFA